MIYRKEIDGLRALAVIPVILFHGGVTWVSGGYVGVDIFFVISGYLITTIILKEKTAGTFTIAGFYERRARRILPALFFVLLTCLPFAWFWLLPHELKDFGKSVVAVALFISNILFWKENDYFSADAELIPLLHTWSLAVEEQFYLIFPLIIMLFWKFGKKGLLAILIIIALLSVAVAEWAWRNAPTANFYLITSRAWELMIGALVAFYLFNSHQPRGVEGIRSQTARGNMPGLFPQLASFTGLCLILYAIFFFDDKIPFPSLYALAPTIGSALIILYATPHTWVFKILSIKLFTGIGLISYSAYLWHQPLFAFAKILSMDEIHLSLIMLLILATFGLAFLSWRFVEKPFRNRQRFTRKQIFTGTLIGSFSFIIIGFSLMFSDGYGY